MAADVEAPADQFEPLVCCRGERNNLAVDRVTGEIFAECACCGNMQRLYDDDQYAEAEATGIAWAERVARDYAAVLDQAGYAQHWREAYLMLADVLHGGESMVAARAAIARGFNLPANFTPGGNRG